MLVCQQIPGPSAKERLPLTAAISAPISDWIFPWQPHVRPLMLAPMQGLTNCDLRDLLIARTRPDVVFSEFIRIAGGKHRTLRPAQLQDIAPRQDGVPLVAQLIGYQPDLLAEAAKALQDCDIQHINLNLGCPFGRTTSSAIGGELLSRPDQIPPLLEALRKVVTGSFSVKMRSGYESPESLFTLLPVMEAAGVDFLILHPRTVLQGYRGNADHQLTAEAVRRCRLPIIANGDITTAHQGQHLLSTSQAAGLMIGRGALADPLLFRRLRDQAAEAPSGEEIRTIHLQLLGELLTRYRQRYCGPTQVLAKLSTLLPYLQGAENQPHLNSLKRCKTLDAFAAQLQCLEDS